MATSSTLPAVKAQLVSLLSTALASSGVSGGAVPVFYGWDPDVTDESVFLGRAQLDPSDRDEIVTTYEYPVAELNRPCFETYAVPISVWSFRPDLSASEADEAEERILGLQDLILGVLEDIDLGVGVHAKPERGEARRVPFQSGWACFVVTDLSVNATLT